MTTPAVQTLWAELIAGTLADAGVRTCVISPGSRSTPLVVALAAEPRLAVVTIIDERAAAFYALGVARATGEPCALACTSGSAAAHYLPAFVEASTSGIPLVALTADRPSELQACGAAQTIDQRDLYGRFVREAFDLGAPTGTLAAARAVRRTIVQAVTRALGPAPGPVHVNVPLRKPLEPALPATDDERTLARDIAELRRQPITIAPPELAPDRSALHALAEAIAAEPHGVIVAGALPASASVREAVFSLALRAGYPLLAEASSNLRLGTRPRELAAIDHFDLVLGAPALAGAPAPRLIVQLGAEPVAQGWAAAQPALAGTARWVLTTETWRDPSSSARAVIAGELATSLAYVADHVVPRDEHAFGRAWRDLDARAAGALDRAIAAHPRSETAVVRSALDAVPAGTLVQIGNSLPIRVVDHARGGGAQRMVIAQRGAAGIDGLVASAAGATRSGRPVLLVLGDVSFAHDLGGLLAARAATTPLAIVVIDNGGGRIFGALPIARSASPALLDQHFVTPPGIDPAAIAVALGARAITAATPAAVASAVAGALTMTGPTVIHAPVIATGAHDVRRDALALLATSPIRHAAHASTGARHA